MPKRSAPRVMNFSASCSTCNLSYTTTGNFTAVKYPLSDHASFILIQETIYGDNHKVLVSSKHYIPIELFKMQINSTVRREDYNK